jgi:hypothetical protein
LTDVLESRKLTYREGQRSLGEQIRHAKEQFQANARNKAWWYFEFTQQVVPNLPSGPKSPSPGAIRVMDQPWDNLIILDACRADAFKLVLGRHSREFGNLGYTLRNVESLGTYTPEFLTRNFAGGPYPDTVYVSANPYVSSLLPEGTFGEVVHVWRNAWSDKFQTVLPRDMAKASMRARRRFPGRRLIVHFMQPHTPFVGSYRLPGEAFWDIALNQGLQNAKRAYIENLEAVFRVLPPLLDYFRGRTVVSADHGEGWGEPAPPLQVPIFGHPKKVHIASLTTVPWMEIPKRGDEVGEEERFLKASLSLTRSGLAA